MADIEQTIDFGDPERRRKVIKYYLGLKAAWQEFGELASENDDYEYRYPDNFNEWLEETYGFTPHIDEAGNFAQGHDVVDEAKYTFFLLKYSK